MDLHLLLDLPADVLPDRVVLQDGDRTVTTARLRSLAQRGAAAVREGEHDAIVYIGPWGLPFAVAVFAASYAGVPIVPLNYRLGPDQLAALVANHPAALLVLESSNLLGDAATARAARPEEWLEQLVAAHEPDEQPPAGDGTAPAVLLYTSGTTAEPKAAILRGSNLTSYVMSTVELASAPGDDAVLVTTPPYHVAGLANLLSNLFAGRRMVAASAVTGDAWLDAVAVARVTQAFVVPTLLQRIVEAQRARPRPLPTLRAIAYGGSRTPTSVILAAIECFPEVAFTQAYGLTETSSTIAVLGPDVHRAAAAGDEAAIRRLSSVGVVVPGIEVEIRDELGVALAVGDAGRIWLRGDQVSGEYANHAAARDADGWFDTRDRGHLDADGYLYVHGREDDTIIRGAENIAPAEIEDVLLAHPAVSQAVVVGLPDLEWGQVPAAAVVCRPGAAVAPADLVAWARSRLRGSKTPVRVEQWDELPMTDTGKLLRRAALQRLVEDAR